MVPGTGIETGTRSTTSLRSVAQDRLFRDPDFKLRRFAGVSAAGATRRNPEVQRGISAWCPGPESNRYVPFGTRDFKSRRYSSANSIPKSHVVDSVRTSVRPILVDECIGEHVKAQEKHTESTLRKHARTSQQEPTANRCRTYPDSFCESIRQNFGWKTEL